MAPDPSLQFPPMASASPSPAAAGLTLLPVRRVPVSRPLQWLRLGWRDLTRTPWPSLLHGLLVAAGGLAMLAVSRGHWSLASGAFSGFVLVGPILATGLYELSRLLARGEQPTLADAITAWRRSDVLRPMRRLTLGREIRQAKSRRGNS